MILPSAFLALTALSTAAATKVDIFLNVDNDFALTFNGGSPVIDAMAQAPQLYNWQFTNHFTHTVADDQPLLIAINATDYGVIAGIAAVVLLDGELYAATNPSDNNFLFSQKALTGWNSDVNYDDSTWTTIAGGTVGTTCDQAGLWGDVLTQLANAAKVPVSLGVSMAWPGGCHNVNTITYVRLVIEPAPAPSTVYVTAAAPVATTPVVHVPSPTVYLSLAPPPASTKAPTSNVYLSAASQPVKVAAASAFVLAPLLAVLLL
ncbi:hypothetical protein HK101_008807 [Irineochytrium annulatum]|nr:hypothetical protein HK101_008807 [Irineochytrium annulatum]